MTPDRVIEYPGSPNADHALLHMLNSLDRRGDVYFVGLNQWVKIGYSRNPYGRFQKLDCLPEPLNFLAVVSGCRSTEAELHKRFASLHSNAEWFFNRGKLSRYILTLRGDALRKILAA